jgi:hypothetical protein
MRSFYKDVPKLGDVRVPDHVQERAREQNISTEMFEHVLFHPVRDDVPDGCRATWRERNGIRIVITVDQKDAPLVAKTVYRVKAQAIAWRH